MADDGFGYKLARTLSPLSNDAFRSVPAGPWPERVKTPDHDVLIAADAVLGVGEPGDVFLVKEPENTGYPSHGVPFEPDLLIGFVPVKTGYGPPSHEMLETVKANEGNLEAILDELRRMAENHEDPVLRTNARILLMKVEEITGKETWTP